MNITGIIAEYNPFHNGHAFQSARARKETEADFLIIVMSGNYVQRGAPALLDKFTRAEMALSQGADLVIELPALWASASAEYFAGAGISLLNQLGCVSTLCYGCETSSHDVYAKICGILNAEPPKYRQLLAKSLKTGSSFALARENALLALLPEPDKAAAMEILKNPNNILALEYQKALAQTSSTIRVHPILRQGQGYHSDSLSGSLVSASAIRQYLASHPADAGQSLLQSIPADAGQSLLQQTMPTDTGQSLLRQTMPAPVFRLLLEYNRRYPFLYENDCSQMLHYCLLKNAAAGFSDYADCTAELSNRICRHLDEYTGFSDFCKCIKSKNMAYTRISRVLMHILLDIRQDDYLYWRSRSYVPYAKILGFRKDADILLAQLKKHTSIPLLTHAADAKKMLPAADGYSFFQKNLFADTVYRALVCEKGGRKMKHELSQQIVIV